MEALKRAFRQDGIAILEEAPEGSNWHYIIQPVSEFADRKAVVVVKVRKNGFQAASSEELEELLLIAHEQAVSWGVLAQLQHESVQYRWVSAASCVRPPTGPSSC